MSRSQNFVVTKRTSEGVVYLAKPDFRESIWHKDRSEATEFHSKIDAEKEAKTHGGEMKQEA